MGYEVIALFIISRSVLTLRRLFEFKVLASSWILLLTEQQWSVPLALGPESVNSKAAPIFICLVGERAETEI